MKSLKTRKEHCGKLARSAHRVGDNEAERCERSLDRYLDGIIKWHPSFTTASSREAAVKGIAEYLQPGRGQTFIEQVYVIWRFAMGLRARVLEIRAKRNEHVEAA